MKKTNNQAKRLPSLLRTFLSRSKIKPAELSRLSGVPKPSLSNIIAGKRGAADETLVAVSKALSLSPAETTQLLLAARLDTTSGDVLDAWQEIEGLTSGKGGRSAARVTTSPRKETPAPIDTTHLDWLNNVIRGLANGLVQLKLVPGPAQEAPVTRGHVKLSKAVAEGANSTPAVTEAGRGRGKQKMATGNPRKATKPTTPAARPKKLARPKKIKAGKRPLPLPRDIFLFLKGKIEGVKLLDIVSEFGVNHAPLKALLDKLTAKGDLDASKGRFFLLRRLRASRKEKAIPAVKTTPSKKLKIAKKPKITKKPKAPKKSDPIPESAVLDYLGKSPGVTIHQMAADMGLPSHHRLIMVTNRLRKAGKVVVESGKWSFSGSGF